MKAELLLLRGCPEHGDGWAQGAGACEACAALRELARVHQERLEHERTCPRCRAAKEV